MSRHHHRFNSLALERIDEELDEFDTLMSVGRKRRDSVSSGPFSIHSVDRNKHRRETNLDLKQLLEEILVNLGLTVWHIDFQIENSGVFKVTHSEDDREAIIKMLNMRCPENMRIASILNMTPRQIAQREIDFYTTTFGSPYVVTMWSEHTCPVSSHSLVFMEYTRHGDLFDFVVSRFSKNKGIRNKEVVTIFTQLLEGVQHLHDHGIAHRDLKLENVLYFHNVDSFKIADLGLSCRPETDLPRELSRACGSPDYISFDMLKVILNKTQEEIDTAFKNMKAGNPYDRNAVWDHYKNDCWALGIILYVLLVGQLPYNTQTNKLRQLYKSMKKKLYWPARVPKEARRLVRRLLDKDPITRYSIQEALVHPWIMSYQLNRSTGSLFLSRKDRRDIETLDTQRSTIVTT